jgi:hypothetical protein
MKDIENTGFPDDKLDQEKAEELQGNLRQTFYEADGNKSK